MRSKKRFVCLTVFLLVVVASVAVAATTPAGTMSTGTPSNQSAPAAPSKPATISNQPSSRGTIAQSLPPKPLRESLDFDAAAKRVIFSPATNGPLERACKEILEDIYRLCGLTLPEGKVVKVFFQDIPTQRGGITYAITYPEPYGSRIVFSSRNVAARRQNARHIFQHEMTHALQESWMGEKDYWKLAWWVQEGLATYVGGHGPERIQKFGGTGPALINGLLNGKAPQDYAEAYLAYVYIEKRWGAEGLKTFVRDHTINRTPWQQALQKVTKLDWPAFEAAVKEFSIAYLKDPNKAIQLAQSQAGTPVPKPGQQQLQQSSAKPQQTGATLTQTSPLQQAQVGSAAPPTRAAESQTGKPDLGLYLQDIDEETAEHMRLPVKQGVMIAAVVQGGPGDKAGLEAGDIMTEFNGQRVPNTDRFQMLLDATRPGAQITLQILREGRPITAKVQVGTKL